MSKNHDEELDDFFRKGMEDPVDNNNYREQDWNDLENMLDKHKKRRGIVYWLPVLGAVAALLLLFLGWWAFQPKNVKYNQSSVKAQRYSGNGAIDTPKQLPAKTQTGSANYADARKPATSAADSTSIAKSSTGSADYANARHKKTGTTDSTSINKSTTGSADYAKNGKTIAVSNSYTKVNNRAYQSSTNKSSTVINKGLAGGETPSQRSSETLAAISASPFFEPGGINTPSLSSYYINNPAKPAAAKNKTEIKKQGAFRPQYALTVMAAPDINGVESFQQAQVGTNLGLIFSARVLKKLTISTGAIYSDKPYTIASQDYHTPYQFPVSPQNIAAVCHMLDIPLNVNYQLYSKHQNKIFVGTGLSSYIMLNENYKFNYNDPYYYGKPLPSSYTVPHSESYFFGVVNLSATYQRQLNSKIALDVQPYYKLPISDLGYGQVRLQSTGVAVGLTWNFNSLSKH